MSMKNSNDTIGNRTRYLPSCSAVPQPTAPPRTPFYSVFYDNRKIMALFEMLFVLVAVTLPWRWVWRIGGMVLTKETRGIYKETCLASTLCAKVPLLLAWSWTRVSAVRERLWLRASTMECPEKETNVNRMLRYQTLSKHRLYISIYLFKMFVWNAFLYTLFKERQKRG